MLTLLSSAIETPRQNASQIFIPHDWNEENKCINKIIHTVKERQKQFGRNG